MKLAHAILAGLQVISGATALLELLPEPWPALVTVAVGATQAGVAAYRGGAKAEPGPDCH